MDKCKIYQVRGRRMLQLICGILTLALLPMIRVFRPTKNHYVANSLINNGSFFNSEGSNLKLLTFTGQGRLGNKMFRYASAYAIARQDHRVLLLPPSHDELMAIFKPHLQCSLNFDKMDRSWHYVNVASGTTFDERLFQLSRHKKVSIHGYLHSWKYFIRYADDVRRQFQFSNNVSLAALSSIRSHFSCAKYISATGFKVPCNIPSRKLHIYVGIHVRRGDFTSKIFSEVGFKPSDELFIFRAMEYYCYRFSKIVFIVCGDDLSWNARSIRLNSKCSTQLIIHCRPTKNPAVHMALLASCNHSIITTGTFGWWTAFLAGGQVVYDKSFPHNGSILDKKFSRDDYYLPHWIGL